MQPEVSVDREASVIRITLKQDMTLEEIQRLTKSLETAVRSFNQTDTAFSVLSDASEKTFVDLVAVKALSFGLKEVLAKGVVRKVATVRPQGDYPIDREKYSEDVMDVFSNITDAEAWLAQ